MRFFAPLEEQHALCAAPKCSVTHLHAAWTARHSPSAMARGPSIHGAASIHSRSLFGDGLPDSVRRRHAGTRSPAVIGHFRCCLVRFGTRKRASFRGRSNGGSTMRVRGIGNSSRPRVASRRIDHARAGHWRDPPPHVRAWRSTMRARGIGHRSFLAMDESRVAPRLDPLLPSDQRHAPPRGSDGARFPSEITRAIGSWRGSGLSPARFGVGLPRVAGDLIVNAGTGDDGVRRPSTIRVGRHATRAADSSMPPPLHLLGARRWKPVPRPYSGEGRRTCSFRRVGARFPRPGGIFANLVQRRNMCMSLSRGLGRASGRHDRSLVPGFALISPPGNLFLEPGRRRAATGHEASPGSEPPWSRHTRTPTKQVPPTEFATNHPFRIDAAGGHGHPAASTPHPGTRSVRDPVAPRMLAEWPPIAWTTRARPATSKRGFRLAPRGTPLYLGSDDKWLATASWRHGLRGVGVRGAPQNTTQGDGI